MTTKTIFSFPVILWAAVAFGQNPALVTLEVDVSGGIGYEQDTFDNLKYGADPNAVPRSRVGTWATFHQIWDVVAVNGKPVKGTLVFRSTRLALSPNARPGQT